MNSDNDEKTLIFIHLPKTGGTTLHWVIDRQYKPDVVFSNDRVIYSKLGEKWKRLNCMDRWRMSEDIFRGLPLVERERFKVIKGHMRFGWHDFCPQPCVYATVLRDPIDLVISYYYYLLRLDQHVLRDEILSKDMTLRDFTESGVSLVVNNIQTRLLSGVSNEIEFGECSVDILETAKKNLKEFFPVVGLIEKFDETLSLLSEEFGWGLPFYIKRNVTENRPSRYDVSEETLKTIIECNRLDIELYAYADQMYQHSMSKQPLALKRRIKRLEMLNNVVNRLYRPVNWVTNGLKQKTKEILGVTV